MQIKIGIVIGIPVFLLDNSKVKLKTLYIALGIAVIVVGGFFGLQVPLKKKYDGLRDQVIAATQFVAHPINDETREFLESVRGTWMVHDREEPDPAFSEISTVTGIPNTVDGVVEFHTHTIAPYSFIDFSQNKKESLIALAMAIALPTSMDARVYHGEGICFVKVNESLVEVYEDSEKGLSRVLYMKAKSGAQGAAELPATAGDSK